MNLLFLGYYCVASTALVPMTNPTPCPAGTFGAEPGLAAESDCTQCLAGTYCATTGKGGCW